MGLFRAQMQDARKPTVAALSQTAQQPPTPTPPQATFRSATNLVEVDVVVQDREGRFVPGLTIDDLAVLEDGQPQQIQQFYLVSSARAGASGTGETAQRPAPEDPRGRRIFVFAFDEGHLSTESLTRVKVGIERFLSAQFAPGDVGGVFTNNAMFRGRLTTSKIELLSAVRSNVSLRLIVVDPALRETKNESLLTLTRLSDARDERILLFAGTFAEFTTRLPDMAPQDAHEAHDERVRGTSI